MQKTQENGVLSLGQEDSRKRKGQLTPVFLRRISHGQKSLASYSLCIRKELDMTEASDSACTRSHNINAKKTATKNIRLNLKIPMKYYQFLKTNCSWEIH